MPLLNHRNYGNGQPVIYILHGIFGMLDNWHYVAGKLGETCTVVTSDARNHGKSFHDNQMDFETMAADVRELMQALNHSEIILMGHSMGGKTAMKFAELYPQYLQKLIVVDIANKSYPPGHLPYFEAFETIDFSRINSRAEAEQALLPYAPELGVRQFLLKNLEPIPGGGYRSKFNLPGLKANYDKVIGRITLKPDCYTGPTLFIHGAKSGYIKPEDEADLRINFPNARFEEVTNAGHWVHADNPAEFLDKIQTFIRN